MAHVTFEEFLYKAAKEKSDNPTHRMGQVYCNVLWEVNQPLAEKIVAKPHDLDPFYDDGIIGEFLIYVCTHWEDVT